MLSREDFLVSAASVHHMASISSSPPANPGGDLKGDRSSSLMEKSPWASLMTPAFSRKRGFPAAAGDLFRGPTSRAELEASCFNPVLMAPVFLNELSALRILLRSKQPRSSSSSALFG